MIDNRAVIDPSAKIAENVEIAPYVIIGPGVEIGSGTHIGPHVYIHSNTKIGRNNKIHAFAALGGDPQHSSFRGEATYLEIGDDNIIGEFCSIHRGTTQGRGKTHIGNKNFLMTYAHVAHDCVVNNEVVLGNSTGLAGHATIEDFVILSAYCGVHQFATIGAYSFLGRCAKIGQDIPPYMLVVGSPGAPVGLNIVGLKRHGFSAETVRMLRRAYSTVYRQDLRLVDAIQELKKMLPNCPEIQPFLATLENSKRGIAR